MLGNNKPNLIFFMYIALKSIAHLSTSLILACSWGKVWVFYCNFTRTRISMFFFNLAFARHSIKELVTLKNTDVKMPNIVARHSPKTYIRLIYSYVFWQSALLGSSRKFHSKHLRVVSNWLKSLFSSNENSKCGFGTLNAPAKLKQ